tara:strand:- start:443 stop:886 length:444 start_codon:yes stop_codon:yes gene_type:complete
MKTKLNIEEDVINIINSNSISDNIFCVDQNDSIKISRLFEFSKSKNLDLIIEAGGTIFFELEKDKDKSQKHKPISHRNLHKREYFTSRVYVRSCLNRATEELTADIIDQFEEKFGSIDYELGSSFTEGFRLMEINESAIVVELECGS